MTIVTVAPPRLPARREPRSPRWRGSRPSDAAPPGAVVRPPCPPGGLQSMCDRDWSGARYEGLLVASRRCCSASRWPASRRSAGSWCRSPTRRRWQARALARSAARRPAAGRAGGAAVVAAVAVWLRLTGGLDLGDEPGRTQTRTTRCPSCSSRCCSPASRSRVGRGRGAPRAPAARGLDRAGARLVPRRRDLLDVQRPGACAGWPRAGPAGVRRGRPAETPTPRPSREPGC